MSNLYTVLAVANDDRWDHMDGWGGGWMWLWGIAMMALFVVLIVWLVRAATGGQGTSGPPPNHPTDRAREILAERYARGELTTEEYQERAERLR
ncbi:MAG: SHOCT domain-containing protein [Acidimicrobiia bacterium]